MQQFQTLNRQQQPFIQSGYGAMGKLNTLLGIGARPRSMQIPVGVDGIPGGNPGFGPNGGGPGGSQIYRPTPGGGIKTIPGMGPQASPRAVSGGGSRLSRLLMLRAMNGDSEAARILGVQ